MLIEIIEFEFTLTEVAHNWFFVTYLLVLGDSELFILVEIAVFADYFSVEFLFMLFKLSFQNDLLALPALGVNSSTLSIVKSKFGNRDLLLTKPALFSLFLHFKFNQRKKLFNQQILSKI